MAGYDITGSRLRCVLPFEAVPAEVRLLRRATAKQLSRWGVTKAVGEAELLVTELATNVVKHVGEGAAATLILEWTGERLRLEVHDHDQRVPSLKAAHCDEECGRGLHMLSALAVGWGAIQTAAGKAVWCEISVRSDRACRRIERAAEVLEAYQGFSSGAVPQGRRRYLGLEESAVELIADLLHWSAARGHDPDVFLRRALMHYATEVDAA